MGLTILHGIFHYISHVHTIKDMNNAMGGNLVWNSLTWVILIV